MIKTGDKVEHIGDKRIGRVVYVLRRSTNVALIKWDSGGSTAHNIHYLKKL